MSTIQKQIVEGAHNFEARFGARPEFIFVGTQQSGDVDELIADMVHRGIYVPPLTTRGYSKRRQINGAEIFRVDAVSHLSFGL